MKRKTNILRNDDIPRNDVHRKYCGFCRAAIAYIDYKDPEFLKTFLNPQGKILPHRYSGNCRKHQRKIALAIKRARLIAILPYKVDNYR